MSNAEYLGSDAESIAGALAGRQGTVVDLMTSSFSISGTYVGYRPDQKRFFLLDATTTPSRSGSSVQKTEEAIVDSDKVLRAYAHF